LDSEEALEQGYFVCCCCNSHYRNIQTTVQDNQLFVFLIKHATNCTHASLARA